MALEVGKRPSGLPENSDWASDSSWESVATFAVPVMET